MTKPKAAIFTFCNNNGPVNYGQVLQCFAVGKLLEENGYDHCTVLYQKNKISELMTERVRRFREFVSEYIPTSRPCYTIEDVEDVVKDYDLLVCGSDQVWFPYTIDRVWTLGVGKEKSKRISIAASGLFYDDEITNEKVSLYKTYLEQMDYISVRERSAVSILKECINKDIDIIPDPTLFFGKIIWDELICEKGKSEEYILCYCLSDIRPYDLIFKRLSDIYGNIKIKYIVSNLTENHCYAGMEPVYDAGPKEFIGLIREASAVVTDSFHGVIFSVIYGKDWYNLDRMTEGIDRFGGRTRVNNLLSLIPGDCGWIRNVKDVDRRAEILKTIDYSGIKDNVKAARDRINNIISDYDEP